MGLEKRVERLEQQDEGAEQPSNVVIYNPSIPGDLERKEQEAIKAGGQRSLIFIPDNGRGRNGDKTTD